MKILSTMKAGRVVRQTVYSPKDANPRKRHGAISVSKEDRKKANLKTSYEKLLMRMCANFEPGDWWVTVTYDDEHLPQTRQDAQPVLHKFFRWLRRQRKLNGETLKYIYCTQLTTRNGGRRLHHHMVIRFEDDSDEDLIRSLWIWGDNIHIRKLKDYDDILSKAHYMCREPRELGVFVPGEQMWTASRGLICPQNTYTTIDSDAVDISVPVGCAALQDPVQLPGYGGYKTIIYCENI